MQPLICILIGLAAGIYSGLLGLGGGLIMVPLLIWAVGLNQHEAQGTSLGVILLPVAFPAVLQYWRAGQVNLAIVAFLAIGFLAGSQLGGLWVQNISGPVLRKVFGGVMLLISLQMIFKR